MRIKKKHQAGAAKNFITRTQAVKKLQLSLADFRRICIFKGIYPRAPRSAKKANKGSTAPVTFYYTKDIQYLLHEPVIQKFRDHKAFAKKLSKLLGRGEVSDAKRLDDNRPRYKLDKIVKERYPTFLDAVRDLDDTLSTLFLFAAIPASDKVSAKVTEEAEKLCNQWMAYVARERLLRKVFVSIKGIYYEADIKGQEVVWLVPFKFPQNIPTDVDFRIMLTFLEFYTTLLQFVLFKLYTDSGFVYPPRIDTGKQQGVGGLTAYVMETQRDKELIAEARAATKAITESELVSRAQTISSVLAKSDNKDDNENDDNNNNNNKDEEIVSNEKLDTFEALPNTETAVGDILPQPDELSADDDVLKNLLAPFTFYVGREVSIELVEIAILSLGGKVVSEASLDAYLHVDDDVAEQEGIDLASRQREVDALLKTVTHQVSDRPQVASKVPGRVYVQPQWVFDSLNKARLQPVDDYAVGATLPPHLSPWGDGAGYDPDTVIEGGEEDEEDEEEDEEIEVADEDVDQEEDDEDEDEALQHQRELEKEAKGILYSKDNAGDNKKRKRGNDRKLTTEEKQAVEEKELRKIMMTNKQKKLYNQMQYGINKKEERKQKLTSKRRRIDTTKTPKRQNLNTGPAPSSSSGKGKKAKK
ncbi:Pescadillo N-terminus-domain-containing protein [Lipomyces japonicus]|uniref:Pescadillo N-terminus-domain-containing protein n=1 Tax=Lipomyces japonicus TaxID=56871 RepID=UPI0034D0019F